MSDSLRRFLIELQEKGEIRSTNPLMKKNGQRLIDLGAISPIQKGRSEFYKITNQEIFQAFTKSNFPSGLNTESSSRLDGILHSRDSKKGGNATEAPIILRAFTDQANQSLKFNARELTEQNGITAVIAGFGNTSPSGLVAVVENMDVFLKVEQLVLDCDTAIYAAGKLDSRVIQWISNSKNVNKVIHLGDYDAVGLQEFHRLDSQIEQPVEFFLPSQLTLEHFTKFGKKNLVASGRNLEAFKQVQSYPSQDIGFNRAIDLIRESGRGLEQEILLSLI